MLGIVVPGVAHELDGEVPEHDRPFWDWEFCSFHSADWWRRHWAKTGLVQVERSERLEDGWRFCATGISPAAEARHDERREGRLSEAKMLEIDNGRTFGFVRTIAKSVSVELARVFNLCISAPQNARVENPCYDGAHARFHFLSCRSIDRRVFSIGRRLHAGGVLLAGLSP